MRSVALRRTSLIRPFVGADSCLVAQLALIGRFGLLSENLMCLRHHAGACHSMRRSTHYVDSRAEANWFHPDTNARFILPHWRCLWEYLCLALRSSEALGAKAEMVGFLAGPFLLSRSKPMIREVLFNVGLGALYVLVKSTCQRSGPLRKAPGTGS